MKKLIRYFISFFRINILPAKSYFEIGDKTEILKTPCIFKRGIRIGSIYCAFDCEENITTNRRKRYIRCRLMPTGTGLNKINNTK